MTDETLAKWRELPLDMWTHEALRGEVERLRASEVAWRNDFRALREEFERQRDENAAMREIVQAVAKSKPIINPHPQVIDVPVLFSISDDLVEIHEKAHALLAENSEK